MAYELLQAKRDMKELKIHWIKVFLKRHSILKLRFVSGLEKERVAAKDPVIIKAWFELIEHHIKKNAVEKEDMYNMDEKEIIINVIEKVKIIILKHEKR